MPKLIATFKVQLPNSLLVKRSKKTTPHYRTRIDDFEVNITLNPKSDVDSKQKGEKYYTYIVSEVSISVRRDEAISPPPAITPEGPDFSARYAYLDEREAHYRQAALTVVNRLMRFFKYELRNALMSELALSDEDLQIPRWTDENNNSVGVPRVKFSAEALPWMAGYPFGAKPLSEDDDFDLQKAIKIQIVPELYEELLSDAQAAIFQGNLRRAVLEMAIACEVAIKQTYFAKSPAAEAAFDYLITERYMEVPLTEFINKLAKKAFGESFNEVGKGKHFQNIKRLFECRNKVAHKGQAIYLDGDIYREVDIKILAQWWQSLEELISWLNKHKMG
jgi:hypothetical protein